ncbi:hypothetical protein FS837_011508, partial [Tulasnella sp. UAMH 9824]
EDTVSRDHLPQQSETVAEKPLSSTHRNSLHTERSYLVDSSAHATTAHAITDSCGTKTEVDFGPEGVAPGLEPEAPSIDFGSLVPEGDKDKSGAIDLRFVDDGRSTASLVVGGSEQCEVKLEGDDIGDAHCSLQLHLRLVQDNYQRVVLVRPNEPHRTTIAPECDEPSRPQPTLREGCTIWFGANKKHKYRYVPPQQPLPDPFCWATRLFTWNPEAKPNFGGSKSNSSVYLVRKRGSNTRHAMKVIQKVRFLFNPALQQMIRREHQALSLLKHPNVLELQHFRRDDVHSRIIFVFPEMRGGNLFDFVVKNRKSGNQQHLNSLAPKVAKQLLSGLKYIHSEDIIHRDIKPDNIFLAEDVPEGTHDPLKVVIGDFGIARLPGEKITETYLSGSGHWFSPLSFREPENAEYDFAIDLWGVALVIWFMIAGPPKPWGEIGEPQHPKETDQLPWDRLENLNISDDCIDFLGNFLVEHPEQCRTIKQTESHSWILDEITVKPNGRENRDASVNDSGVSQEQGTQLWFDDESLMAYHY